MFRFLEHNKHDQAEHAAKKTRAAWFGQITDLFKSGSLGPELWEMLEELLIASDVGIGPSQALLERLKRRVRQERISDSNEAVELLKQELVSTLTLKPESNLATEGTTTVILMIGSNGVGKTTSIAKLTQLYVDSGKHVILGAADTFRAAAIEQLQVWGGRIGVDVVAHQSGSDPSAVAFDTIQAARNRQADVVIIDTAGRLHSKTNLMEEMKKIQRVVSKQNWDIKQQTILAMDATTGQNGLIQARRFSETVNCTGVFLSKLDGTAKGGVVVAIVDELNLPVLYIGTGEQLEDIAPFDPKEFVDALFASPHMC
jgi:fused signal recognition particle receptor